MFSDWSLFYQGVMALALLAGAVAIIWSSWKNKTGEVTSKTILEYKEAVQARDLKIKDLDKQIAVMEEKIKNLELINTQLVDKAFNKELVTKMEQTLDKLSSVVIKSFVPLVQEGGFVDLVKSNHEEIMRELDDVHAVVVSGKRRTDPAQKEVGAKL